MQPRAPLPYLTGFRALAAYLVLFAHSVDTAFSYHGISFLHDYVAVFAYFGMTLFFTLSGFVITYNYYDRFLQLGWLHAAKDFAIARFARLYPLYVAFFIFETYSLLMLWYVPLGAKISYATLTQSWWNWQSYILAPTWSVSTEWFFYAAFACAMWWTIRRKKTPSYAKIRAHVCMFLVLFTSILVLIFNYQTELSVFLDPALHHRGGLGVWAWIGYFAPYVRIGEFIMGAFAARLYMLSSAAGTSQTNRIFCIICGLVIVGIGYYHITHFGYATFWFFFSTNFAFAPYIAYLLYACGRYPNYLTKLLSMKWMVASGKISYSIYLMQFWVYRQLGKLLPAPTWTEPSVMEWLILSANVVILMTASTLVAIITYRLIEIPSQHWIRRRFA